MLFLQSVEDLEVHVREGKSWRSLGSAKIHTACRATAAKLRKERQMLKNLVEDKITQDGLKWESLVSVLEGSPGDGVACLHIMKVI